MLKTKMYLLTVFIMVMLSFTASAHAIRLEGENYDVKSFQDGISIALNDDFSNGKALYIKTPYKKNVDFAMEYMINVPEAGFYSMSGVLTTYGARYASDFEFSVNGSEPIDTSYSLIESYPWRYEGRTDMFGKYNIANVELKKGLNRIKISLLDGDVKSDNEYYIAYLDYLDFNLIEPTFGIKKIEAVSEASYMFREIDEVKFELQFTNYAPKNAKVNFTVENVWGQNVEKGSIVFEEGKSNYILNLGNLPVCWYNLKFEENEYMFNIPMEYYFSVVKPLSDAVDKNTRFTYDAGLRYVNRNKLQKFVKSLEYVGVKQLRETHDPGVPENPQYLLSHYGYQWEMTKKSGMRLLNVNDGFGWTSIRRTPDDLFKAYDMYKSAAEWNEGSKYEYEVLNEMDGSFLVEPADRYSSFFKAAALGINDGANDATVGFGGLAFTRGATYINLMLANDVMDYSNYYIYHVHHNTGEGKQLNDYPAGKAIGHVVMANAYDNTKPAWMNEGGLSMPYDKEKGSATIDTQINQARYYIVATAQGLSVGEDKRSWFRLASFNEQDGTFGAHSANLNPYIVMNSISALHNCLGAGVYKGELKNLPYGAEGYLFDNGTNDVAVVWCETTDTYTISSEKPVVVTDFVGAETIVYPVNGKVTLPISYYPVFISFAEMMNEDEYIAQEFKNKQTNRIEFEENDRIIIQQIWENEDFSKAKNSGYTVDIGEQQKVNVKVYNFNSTEERGTIRIKTGSMVLDENILQASPSEIEFNVKPMQAVEYQIVFSLSDEAKPGDCGYVMIEGELSDGRKLSSSKARFTTTMQGRTIEEYTEFENWEKEENWDETVAGECSVTVEEVPEEQALEFDLKFKSPSWAWPSLTIDNPDLQKGSQGITFKVKNGLEGVDNNINVFLYYEDGTNYWLGRTGFFKTSDEWTQIVIPYKNFICFSSALGLVDTRGLVPELVKYIGIGSDKTEMEQTFLVKDVGFYFSELPADLSEIQGFIEINDIIDEESYKADMLSEVTAILPEIEFKEIKVLLNNETYENYSVENGVLSIDLSSLPMGKYMLEIAAIDEWNDARTSWVDFYVE